MKEATPSRRICARPGCGHDVTHHTLMLEGHCTAMVTGSTSLTASGSALGFCPCTAFVFVDAGATGIIV